METEQTRRTIPPWLQAARPLGLHPRRTRRSAWERRLLDTAERVPLPSGETALRWGDGPPVLLVHGWEGRSTQLGRFVGPVRAAGFSAVAVDAPGHGDSTATLFSPGGYVDLLVEVDAAVGPVAAVVAHSLGAAATAGAVREGLRPDGAVFVAPLGSVTDLVRRGGEAVGAPSDGTPDLLELAGTLAGRPTGHLDLAGLAPGGMPVLLCHDTDDEMIPVDESRRLAARWHDSGAAADVTFVETSGFGHFLILRSPAVLAATERLLRRVRGTRRQVREPRGARLPDDVPVPGAVAEAGRRVHRAQQ